MAFLCNVAIAKTVKARVHAGADSLDLTVPTEICRHHRLSAGDVWTVHASREGGKVVLRYVRVHSVNGG